MRKGKVFMQKGEVDFIESYVRSILVKYVSREHFLIDENEIMRYESILIQNRPIVELTFESGERAKVVCVFGK